MKSIIHIASICIFNFAFLTYSSRAQTPVTLSTVNIYGPAGTATVTFRPVHQIGIDYPNYVLGDSINVTPTNGLVTTQLLEGPYIISFSGLFASQRVYVPGLWITNMGYTLPLNLASAAWQFPVGTTTIIVPNNNGNGGGGSATNVFFASGTNTSYRLQNGTNIFDVPDGIFDPFGYASNALSGATNLAAAAQSAAEAASDPVGAGAAAAQQATNTLAAGVAATYLPLGGNGSGLTGITASQVGADAIGAAVAALNSAIAFTSGYTNQMTNAVTSAAGANHISITATTNSSGIALSVADASQTNATLNNIANQVSTPINGGGITNVSGATITSSNASVTIGLSQNPLTGETNYDLAVIGGSLIPNVLVTNNAAAGSGAWTNNSGFRMVSATMDLTNSSENVSNLNIVQLSIGGFPIVPAATNIVVENTNGVATSLTIWGSPGMTNSIVFGPTFDTRTNTRTGTSEIVGGSGITFGTSNLIATAGYGIISNAAVIYSGTNVWTFFTNGTVFLNGVGVLNANSPVNATNLSGTAAISVQLQNSSLLPPSIPGASSLQPFLLGSAGGQFLGSTVGIGVSNGVDLFANALGLTNLQPANIATNSGSGGNVLTMTTTGAAWNSPVVFTNGVANSTAQTNLHFGGVTTFQAFPGFETPTNSFQLSARGALFNYPVPYFRPTSTNSVIAFDVMPSGSPQDQASGTTWGDWCNTDLYSNLNGAVSTARIAVHSNYAEIGTYSYNGAPNIPFQITAYGQGEMQFKSANLIAIGNANNFQFNPGFGGANEIPPSSLFDTPVTLNLSLLSSGTRFDIDYLDHSSVYRSAFTVSNNIPTGFSTLWLMKSGGNTVVGGGIGSLATNATLVVTATGITNTTGVNYRICGFTGASVTQTNPLTTIGFSRGTITVPTDILLQPNEYLNGSSCAAAGGQSF